MPDLSEFEKDGVVYDLKDTHARGEVAKRVINPAAAKVGDFLRVLEVNENNVPISWESVTLSANVTEWKFAGRYTVEENVNPFVVTKDADGTPLKFRELFIDFWVGFFHLASNVTNNRDLHFYDENGKILAGIDMTMPFMDVLKADTEPEEAYAPGNRHGGVHFYRVGKRLYAQGGMSDDRNNADRCMFPTYMNKGVECDAEYFTGFNIALGYATNLLRKGSFMDVYYK